MNGRTVVLFALATALVFVSVLFAAMMLASRGGKPPDGHPVLRD